MSDISVKKEALHSQPLFYLVLDLVASLGHEQHGQVAAFQRRSPATGLMCWMRARPTWPKKNHALIAKRPSKHVLPVWRTLEPFSSEDGWQIKKQKDPSKGQEKSPKKLIRVEELTEQPHQMKAGVGLIRDLPAWFPWAGLPRVEVVSDHRWSPSVFNLDFKPTRGSEAAGRLILGQQFTLITGSRTRTWPVKVQSGQAARTAVKPFCCVPVSWFKSSNPEGVDHISSSSSSSSKASWVAGPQPRPDTDSWWPEDFCDGFSAALKADKSFSKSCF